MKEDIVKWVVDPTNFKGYAITSMHDGIHNDYEQGETLEELRIRENNPNLNAVSWSEVEALMDKYENDLQTEFEEMTEERYDDLLNCLPPARWKGTRFFISEGYSGSLHQMCFQLENKKYYGALRSIRLSDAEISQQINDFRDKLKAEGKW